MGAYQGIRVHEKRWGNYNSRGNVISQSRKTALDASYVRHEVGLAGRLFSLKINNGLYFQVRGNEPDRQNNRSGSKGEVAGRGIE